MLIYIALFGIVALLIGRQFNAMIKNFSAGRSVARQQTDARDILGLMVREIRNTGVKIYFRNSSGSYTKDTASGTWVGSGDMSSFRHTESSSGSYGDQLIIYYLRLRDNGDSLGIDTVKYYLDGTTLRRDWKSNVSPKSTNSVVAENVYALQFQYGVYGMDTLLFKDSLTNTANWTLTNETGTAPTKSTSGTLKLTFTASAKGYVKYKTYCNVVRNRKYSVMYRIDQSEDFSENLDSLRFEFASSSQIYGFEKFRPHTGDRRLTIQNSNTGSAETRLLYSVNGRGVIDIQAIEVRCIADSAYTWKDNPTTVEKARVRAIRIYVLTRTRQKGATKETTPIQVANVSVPRSGEYAWRLYRETVETPNNGQF